MGKRGNFRRRERMRRALSAVEHECWLCLGARGPLDFSLPATHPLAVEIDEEVPVSRGGDPLDLSNAHLVHRYCNIEKGGRVLPRGAFYKQNDSGAGGPETSRNWFSPGE